MFKEELKKLYIKHFGLILTIVIIAAEIVILNFSYQKQDFTTSTNEQSYFSYMEEFSGKLTEDKKAAILAEQERIVDAQNVQSSIEKKLLNGEYDSESEFLSQYERVREITDRKEGLDLVMEQYYYAEKFPDTRYLAVGDYSALGQDFPDIPLLAAVIFLTALLFLNEETSNVITFIRIGENGRNKTLLGKTTALLVFVLSCQAVRMAVELIILISQGSFTELSYPIQSIEFYQNCPYDISIVQGFIIISLLRTVGYLFVAALVVLLSVTLRKVLFTVFIPSAFCVLQQFAFTPATPAYYLPTGFLRAVGYLRGDVISKSSTGDDIKLFSEIPLAHLLVLIALTILFIGAAVATANKYYLGGTRKKLRLMSVVSVISVCIIMSGCSNQFQNEEIIKYNLTENAFFVEDNDSFYTTDTKNITRHFKNGDDELSVIHELVKNNDTITSLYNIGDNLLYLQNFTVNSISASDYTKTPYYTTKESDLSGFLGINFSTQKDKSNSFFYITGFFTANNSMFYVFNNCVLKDGVCIIDEGAYNLSLCCDGKSIFYINSLLQLKRYDMKTGEISRLSGEFVRTLYYDGTSVLFSDRNGIYELSPDDFTTKKLSDISADQLCSNGSDIFYSKDKVIYRLGSDDPIYDATFIRFAITDNGILVVRNTDFSCKTVDLSYRNW